MNKETLMAMGLTEAQADNVMASLDGSYVTKARFNEVNGQKNALESEKATLVAEKATLETDKAALAGQLATAQAGNGNKAADEQTIQDLQAKLDAANKARLDDAVMRELETAGAVLPQAVMPFLAEYLASEDAVLGEDGKVKGLADKLKEMAADEKTGILFGAQQTPAQPSLSGFVPAPRKDGAPTPGQPSSLKEAVEMALQQPTQN